jgi:Tol biopolymer transport system component
MSITDHHVIYAKLKKLLIRTILAGLVLLLEVSCSPTVNSISSPAPTLSSNIGITQLPLPKRIKVALSPRFNLTGSKIAFVGVHGDRDENLYVYDLTTGTIQAALNEEEFSLVSRPGWSPDGKVTFSGFSVTQKKHGFWAVQIGSDPEFITSKPGTSWSPDGSRLAVEGPRSESIDLINLENETYQRIFRIKGETQHRIRQITWSPDSQTLAFVIEDTINSYRIDRLARIDANGKNYKILNDDPQSITVFDPTWILDGKWLAFVSVFGLDQGIWFVNERGNCTVRLSIIKNPGSMDFMEGGSVAIVESRGQLFIVNIDAALAPLTLEEVLNCK